jgi:monofunctional biosynthetic peptidoglycan transglycosylase
MTARPVTRGLARALIGLAGLALVAVLALQLWYLGHVLWWVDHNPEGTRFMQTQLQILRAGDPGARLSHTWVPYERIAPHLKRAVIAAEDARFNEHSGVDWDAIERAHLRNEVRGRVILGGSTITMQLAKNLFLSGRRSYLRKAQELLIAYMLEMSMSKRRILEIYLNVVEWGTGVFGCEAAARHHYGLSAVALSASQAAELAAMLPRPRFFDRHRDSAALGRRAGVILRDMPAVRIP